MGEAMMSRMMRQLGVAVVLSGLSAPALADVAPLLETAWGQDGVWQAALPVDASGERTAAGCTTIAAAQILYYYQYQATASSDVGGGECYRLRVVPVVNRPAACNVLDRVNFVRTRQMRH